MAIPVLMASVQESYPENCALANGVYMARSFGVRSMVVVCGWPRRLVGEGDVADRAEVAVTVANEFQGIGVGGMLRRQLIGLALIPVAHPLVRPGLI